MSNRTLVELNHDFCPRDNDLILLNWAKAIQTYMCSGDKKYLPQGVEFKHFRHHSEPCPLAEAGCDSAQESAKENDARYYWPDGSLKWGCPENVQHLILQLQTLDPEMKVSSVHHIHMPSGETRARAYGLSMSRERWNETGWLDYSLPVPECLAIWAQPPQELEGVNGPKTQESAPEEWMRQAADEIWRELVAGAVTVADLRPDYSDDEAVAAASIAKESFEKVVAIIRKHAKKGK